MNIYSVLVFDEYIPELKLLLRTYKYDNKYQSSLYGNYNRVTSYIESIDNLSSTLEQSLELAQKQVNLLFWYLEYDGKYIPNINCMK